MTKRLVILAFVLMFLVGFVFLRGPTPHISIRAEALTTVGGIKVTNTMITGWVIVVLIAIGLFLGTRKWTLVPSGIQNFMEAAMEGFYDLVTGIAGEKNGRRFYPFVATIFFFVLISNWLSLTPVFNVIGWVGHEDSTEVQLEEHGFVHGLVFNDLGPLHVIPFSSPGDLTNDDIVIDEDKPEEAHEKYDAAIEEGKTVGELIPLFRGINTDLNTPLAIAIAAFIAVEWWGVSTLGLFKYGSKFINFSGPIDFFVGILELVSELVRLVSFTFRLFGNMFAGEVVILMFTFLTPLVITLPFYGLEIFVGAIQAFIFSMLTLVFGVMAVSAHGDHHDEEHHTETTHGGETIEGALHDAVNEPI